MKTLNIPKEIRDLNITDIKSNLFHYSYKVKQLQNHNFNEPIEENLIQIYNSLKGEIYENIIYELLLQYTKQHKEIKKFILKGPYEDAPPSSSLKNGMTLNKNKQIVFKASYKEVTEYDALFFTQTSVYFVEMSITKKTNSLNRRLDKKYALLKLLFPNYTVQALIVLTEGSLGIKQFPSYATIWKTKEFNDIKLLQEIVTHKKNTKSPLAFNPKPCFIKAYQIRYKTFRYMNTLKSILIKSRSNPYLVVDLNFLGSKTVQQYFDIFTKLYIGFIDPRQLQKAFPVFTHQIKGDKVFISVEKIHRKQYKLVYYFRSLDNKLQRMELSEKEIIMTTKDPKGFTNLEVKFINKCLLSSHEISSKTLPHLEKKILTWKKEVLV